MKSEEIEAAVKSLEEATESLKSSLKQKGGSPSVDWKWLTMLDMALVDIIKARAIVAKAVGGDGAADWAFVLDAVRKDAQTKLPELIAKASRHRP